MDNKVKYGIMVVGAAALLGILGALDVLPTQAKSEKAADAVAEQAAEPVGEPLSKIVEASKIYATVDGEKVTGDDVLGFASSLPAQLQQAPGDRLLPVIVNQLVNDKLLVKAAYSKGIEKSAEVKEAMDAAEKRIVRDTYIRDEVKAKVTDEALRKKYEEMLFNTPKLEQVHAGHILVADEAAAKDVVAKLDKGEDFEKLAKEVSTDPSAKENGGDLGYFTQNQMVKEFADAAFAMEPGTYSKEPVKTQFGYHVIKVLDKRPMPKPEFDQVKGQVQAQLADDVVRGMVSDLRENAKIDLNLPAEKAPEEAAE